MPDVEATPVESEPAPAVVPGRRTIPLPLWTVPASLLAIAVLVAGGSLLAPEAFYDQIIWKYYWGPIEADASGYVEIERNGVVAEPGYNVVNTLSWFLLLGLCLVGGIQLVEWLAVPRSDKFAVGIVLWEASGAVAHVLEDMGLFEWPTKVLFITPLIFFEFAIAGLGLLTIGILLERASLRRGVRGPLMGVALIFAAPALAWAAIVASRTEQILVFVNPLLVAGLAAAAWGVVALRARAAGRVDGLDVAIAGGALVLAWDGAYLALWLGGGAWGLPATDGLVSSLLVGPALALAATAAAAGVGWLVWRRRKAPLAASYLLPLNLIVIFSQALDGFVTAIGVDFRGYTEKHVFSARMIDGAREIFLDMGFAFGAEYAALLVYAPYKVLLGVILVYLIDASSKIPPGNLVPPRNYPYVEGAVKVGIIIVSIGPGLRNLVRLALGV